MPLRHQATKIHKEFYFNKFYFVHPGVLVPWWQKYYFSEWTQYWNIGILVPGSWFLVGDIFMINKIQLDYLKG